MNTKNQIKKYAGSIITPLVISKNLGLDSNLVHVLSTCTSHRTDRDCILTHIYVFGKILQTLRYFGRYSNGLLVLNL